LRESPSYLSPAQPAFSTIQLAVDRGHTLYVAQYGVPDGIPVLVLHGGPGSGNSPVHLQFFAADRYRVILADQRGCGRSVPGGGLDANTTEDLLADIGRMVEALRLDRPLLVGGSWGATLALLCAAAHPKQVRGVLLRTPFWARQADLDWFFGGARTRFPAAWAAWDALGAPEAPAAVPAWLSAIFSGDDTARQRAVAAVWQAWESTLAGVALRQYDAAALDALLPRYRLQCHYFCQGCFLPPDGVLTAAASLAGQALPIHVIQGLADQVCPAVATQELLAGLPHASVAWVPDVGHDPFAPAMLSATRRALDIFADSGSFRGAVHDGCTG